MITLYFEVSKAINFEKYSRAHIDNIFEKKNIQCDAILVRNLGVMKPRYNCSFIVINQNTLIFINAYTHIYEKNDVANLDTDK